MFKKSQISLFLFSTLVFILSIFLYLDSNKSLRVAHAGGQYNNKTYPNSIASINYNSKYTKFLKKGKFDKTCNLVVAEIKYSSKKELTNLFKELPFEIKRFSKYCMGLETLNLL